LQGTRDYSAFLTVPKAIEFLNENNWEEVSKQAKQLILDNYKDLCDLFGTEPICPVTSEFLGQICSVPVNISSVAELKNTLFQKYKIEIPVFQLSDMVFMRLSAQAYVSQEDVDYLKDAIREIKETTDIIR
ncbi:MAG: isopenicillin-N epimerase, partial [Salibacteraceae bacterium]